jgi:hypothetical protein
MGAGDKADRERHTCSASDFSDVPCSGAASGLLNFNSRRDAVEGVGAENTREKEFFVVTGFLTFGGETTRLLHITITTGQDAT